ncbi:MAG: DUF1559 domain-containing protein [Pirellulales bacterium]
MHAPSLRPPGWSLRVILAWAMLLSPLTAVQAQKPDRPSAKPETLDTTWLTPETVAVGYLRLRQVLTAEGAELLPLEIFDAAAKKYLSVGAADIESITFVGHPKSDEDEPLLATIFKFSKPFDLSGISSELTEHTEPAELNGKLYLKSRTHNPSFYLHDETTLIAAPEPMLQKLLQQANEPATGPLIDEVKNRPATDDLYMAVDLKSLRPLIDAALAEQAAQIPPQFQKYLGALDLIRSAEFAFNISKSEPPLLNVYGNDEQAAEALAALIDEGMAEVRQQMAVGMAQQMSDDPVEQALMAYSARRTDATMEALKPVVDGNKLTFFPADPDNPNPSVAQLQKIAVIGFLVALLLPAVQAAREAARRNTSINELRNIMLAMHNYHDTKGQLPAHASYSDDGKPLLSWRVHVLPYLEQQELYNQFHLDEPWDSEHNKQLIAKMPDFYLCPSSRHDVQEGKTTFLAPIGDGLIFDGTKDGARFKTVTDGLSKTIMLVDASDDRAVIWTKPDDLAYDPQDPIAGLAGHHAGIFNAAFADGSVQAISLDIDLDDLRALLTKSGDEVVDR